MLYQIESTIYCVLGRERTHNPSRECALNYIKATQEHCKKFKFKISGYSFKMGLNVHVENKVGRELLNKEIGVDLSMDPNEFSMIFYLEKNTMKDAISGDWFMGWYQTKIQWDRTYCNFYQHKGDHLEIIDDSVDRKRTIDHVKSDILIVKREFIEKYQQNGMFLICQKEN